MRIIDLLNKIANGEEVPKKVKYGSHYWEYDKGYKDYKDNEDDYVFSCSNYDIINMLNNEIEIIEEEKKLHANDIEFNINNDKKDCIITLDENDLGIDKLHLDNCYFYKENDKWYIKKYDFKSFKSEEEKKIPKKLEYKYRNLYGRISQCKQSEIPIIDKINEILDYLEETK